MHRHEKIDTILNGRLYRTLLPAHKNPVRGRGADNYRSVSMAPCSTWRCVALFYNNNTAPTHVAGSIVEGSSAKGPLPVPSAVNSLAWSSVEEHLLTGDTAGFVKASEQPSAAHRLYLQTDKYFLRCCVVTETRSDTECIGTVRAIFTAL